MLNSLLAYLPVFFKTVLDSDAFMSVGNEFHSIPPLYERPFIIFYNILFNAFSTEVLIWETVNRGKYIVN